MFIRNFKTRIGDCLLCQSFVAAIVFIATNEFFTVSCQSTADTAAYDFKLRSGVWLWNVGEYPNPQEMPRNCRRFQKSFVCDPDDILTVEEANSLDEMIKTTIDETPCLCHDCDPSISGIAIKVALLKNIFLNYNSPPSEEIQAFAEGVRQKWKMGNCDDDVLILVSTGDERIYTDVGDDIAKLLPKEVRNKIYLENRNTFKNGNYYQGLESMIRSYSDIILTEASKRVNRSPKKSSVNLIVGLTVGFLVLAALLAGLAFWWTKRKRGRENNRRYSWEMSDSLKRADLNKVQGPYISVRTTDSQGPAMSEKQREGHLESLKEEEEIQFEQMSEDEKRRLENFSEDENIQLDIEEGENKFHETKDVKEKETEVEKSDEEEYFMPRKRSQTQLPSLRVNVGEEENTNL